MVTHRPSAFCCGPGLRLFHLHGCPTSTCCALSLFANREHQIALLTHREEEKSPHKSLRGTEQGIVVVY